MIVSMFLAHLVGDYILQWDALASWKSRELKGVLAHGLVVLLVTWLFALPFNPSWWPWVLFIGILHILIDAVQLYVKPPIPALARFTLDQIAHFVIILAALVGGGYLNLTAVAEQTITIVQNDRLLIYLLAYAFITMPAWVVAKFVAYGLVKGSPPNFPEGTNKYIGIMERILITTFVALGQFLLVPFVTIPRLAYEWPKVMQDGRAAVYVAELLASIVLAVGIGLVLGYLI